MGFLYALAAALFESLSDASLKNNVGRGVPALTAAWAFRFIAGVLLTLPFLFLGAPALSPPFWTALAVSGPINVLASFLYVKALQKSDLSLSVPLLAATPLFLLGTSALFLGERPAPLGWIGVFLIVSGSYVLNIRERRRGVFAPFRALLRETGPRLMLTVGLLWSVSINFDKIGVLHSSPLFWAAVINLSIAAGLLPFFLAGLNPPARSDLRRNAAGLLRTGAVQALAAASVMLAVQHTLVTYAVAVKRLSLLLGVLWGALLFREQGLSERAAGASVMLAGVLFILLA